MDTNKNQNFNSFLHDTDLNQINGWFGSLENNRRLNQTPLFMFVNYLFIVVVVGIIVMAGMCMYNKIGPDFKKVKPPTALPIRYYVDSMGYPYYTDANGRGVFPYAEQSAAALKAEEYRSFNPVQNINSADAAYLAETGINKN